MALMPDDLRRIEMSRAARLAVVRANAESDTPTLYYSPAKGPSEDTITGSMVETADHIVERGFEETTYEAEDRMGGVMLWAYQPGENDGVQGDVLVEVVLNRCVAEYEEQEREHGHTVEIETDRWRCGCGLKFKTSAAAFEHSNAMFRRTGRFFIPIDLVNAHTVSRRRIIPDFE